MIRSTLRTIASVSAIGMALATSLQAQDTQPTPLPHSVVLPELQEKVDGRVKMVAAIDPAGQVANITVLAADSDAISAAGSKALMQWEFQPATRNGQPSIGIYTHTFRFEEGELLIGRATWELLSQRSAAPAPAPAATPIASVPAAATPAAAAPAATPTPAAPKPSGTSSLASSILAIQPSIAPPRAAPGEFAEEDALTAEELELIAKLEALPLEKVSPKRSAYSANLEGEVVIVFHIDADGSVLSFEATDTTHPDLVAPTLDAAAKWKFRGDVLTESVKLQIPFRFEKAPNDFTVENLSKATDKQIDSAPIALLKVNPESTHSEGTVKLNYLVDELGFVSNVSVVESSDPTIEADVVAAIRQWRYKPAIINSGNVPVIMEHTIALDSAGTALAADQLDTLPQAIHSPKPKLKKSLRSAAGHVLVHLNINERGMVTNAQIMESSNPDLDRATREAAEKWVFTPGVKDEKAVPSTLVIPFLYPLAGDA